MLVEKYLAKQLEDISKELRYGVPDIQSIKSLAKVERLVFFSSRLICDGPPQVANVFPTEDQTENSKQKILLISSSLAQVQKKEVYQALVESANLSGLVLREAEIEDVTAERIIGRIDRTWFVLGEEKEMLNQCFEVGLAIHTLVRKLEQSGHEVLYLAQQNPKRFLGVISIKHSVSSKMAELVNLSSQMGVEHILLSSMKNVVAQSLAKKAGIGLVQSELSFEEKRQVLGSLANKNTMVVCDSGAGWDFKDVEKIIVMGRRFEGFIWAKDHLALVELINRSRQIIKKARNKYFWSKI